MGCSYKLGGRCKHDEYHGEVCSRLRPMICPVHKEILRAAGQELEAKKEAEDLINNR